VKERQAMANNVAAEQRPKPGQVVEAYAASARGRALIRRDLVEGAKVKAGGIDAVIDVAREILGDLRAEVNVLRVQELIPLKAGVAQGAWADMDKWHPPAEVLDAILAADVILDYTTNSRGAQKYNEAFHTISSFCGKRLFAYRAVEAPEILSGDPERPIACPDAVEYPSELLAFIADRINDVLISAAEAGAEMRLTNPWGTDIRFRALPGDVCIPRGGIRSFPDQPPFGYVGDDGNRLYVALVGCTVTEDCHGTWVTRHCSLVGGVLSEPMSVTISNGQAVGAGGGPEAARLMEMIAGEECRVHAILAGLNPKAAPFRDGRYLLENKGAAAGVSHIAFGGPGLFYRNGGWGGIGNKHFQLGDIPKISLWAGQHAL